jgi:dinuclear metal center YbgI/SA1388 family protein
MVNRDNLVAFLREFLSVDNYLDDFSYNGLQVEGKESIEKIVGGVSVSLKLIEEAIHRHADTILVHHGLYWKGTPPLAVRSMKKRLKLLLDHNINLFAYHLPLDAHDEVGHNVAILKTLGLPVTGNFGLWEGRYFGKYARLDDPLPRDEIFRRIREKIWDNALILPFGPETIRTVAVASGSSCSSLPEAIEKGIDLFITGEPKEWCEPLARDEGINVVFAGHYHTERFGVIELGRLLEKKFGVGFEFVDVWEHI